MLASQYEQDAVGRTGMRFATRHLSPADAPKGPQFGTGLDEQTNITWDG
jgi:hypothetical protein